MKKQPEIGQVWRLLDRLILDVSYFDRVVIKKIDVPKSTFASGMVYVLRLDGELDGIPHGQFVECFELDNE